MFDPKPKPRPHRALLAGGAELAGLAEAMRAAEYRLTWVSAPHQALRRGRLNRFEVIVLSLPTAGREGGEFTVRMQRRQPEAELVVIGPVGERERVKARVPCLGLSPEVKPEVVLRALRAKMGSGLGR